MVPSWAQPLAVLHIHGLVTSCCSGLLFFIYLLHSNLAKTIWGLQPSACCLVEAQPGHWGFSPHFLMISAVNKKQAKTVQEMYFFLAKTKE